MEFLESDISNIDCNYICQVSEPIKHEEGVRQEERRSQVLHEMNESPHAAVFDS